MARTGASPKRSCPIAVPQRKGDPLIFDRDEGIRPDTTRDSLAKLRVIHEGWHRHGRKCRAAERRGRCLPDRRRGQAGELGLKPIAFLAGWSAVGCDPSRMGIGPVPATAKVLSKTGLRIADMGLVEINEAFAVQVLACLKGMSWDDRDKLNVNGSGISLGHPIGATGVRIMTTLVHEMKRRGRPIWAGDHVHRRRTGNGGDVRASVVTVTPSSLDLTRHIQSGDTVMWGQSHAEPRSLIRRLVEQRHGIGRIRLFLGISLCDILQPEHADAFEFLSYCGSGTNRKLADAGILDILPEHYSRLPRLISTDRLKIDVLFLQVPPPDSNGRYSIGMAREYLLCALRKARVVIGEVHNDVPWTFGGPYLTKQDFAALISSDADLPATVPRQIGPVEAAIGRNVASLIEDNATLQIGIGNIPDATLLELSDRRNLGVHSGAISEGVMALCEAGAITNSRKSVDAGVCIGGALMGGAELRAFAHMNHSLELRGTEYTHNSTILSRVSRLTAINSAVEVDLSGQVNSEEVSGRYLGAVGGIVDFVRAARASEGGVPIVALPSTSRNKSRIVNRLSGPATIPRSEACVIVTEFGIADLRGLSLTERKTKIIGIAHPDHRENLERESRHERRTAV